MKRALANTFCMLLVVTSYLLGECAACRQMLEAQPKSACCSHNKCGRTTNTAPAHHSSENGTMPESASCERTLWMQAPSQEHTVSLPQQLAALPVAALAAPLLSNPLLDRTGRLNSSPPIKASPPDLPTLHSTFRI